MIKIKLAKIMGEHNMKSFKEVSKRTGMPVKTVSDMYYEKTKRIVIEHINKICAMFNCTVTDLVEYFPDKDITENK